MRSACRTCWILLTGIRNPVNLSNETYPWRVGVLGEIKRLAEVPIVDSKSFYGNSNNMVLAQNQPPPFCNPGMAIIAGLFIRLSMGEGSWR